MNDMTTTNAAKLEALYTAADAALHAGDLSAAKRAVDALLAEAVNGAVCADMLPHPSLCHVAEVWTDAALAGLCDAVETLNALVAARAA